jgi:hypothetical protein
MLAPQLQAGAFGEQAVLVPPDLIGWTNAFVCAGSSIRSHAGQLTRHRR